MSVQLPGHPTDICILKHLAGLLVSCTHHNGENLYRENLFPSQHERGDNWLSAYAGTRPQEFLPLSLA